MREEIDFLSIISKTENLIKTILSSFSEKESSFPIEFLCLHSLDRLGQSLNSIKILMKESISENDHGIGLISRNILSDFINISYVFRLSHTEDSVLNFAYNLLWDDLNKAEKFANELKNDGSEKLSDYEKIDGFFTINSEYYHLIKENSENKNSGTTIKSIKDDFIKIRNASDKEDFWVSKVIEAYYLWKLLSKYEHIGWASYVTTINISDTFLKRRITNILQTSILLIQINTQILAINDYSDDFDELYNMFR